MAITEKTLQNKYESHCKEIERYHLGLMSATLGIVAFGLGYIFGSLTVYIASAVFFLMTFIFIGTVGFDAWVRRKPTYDEFRSREAPKYGME